MTHVVRCLQCSSALHEREDCPWSPERAALSNMTPRALRVYMQGAEPGEFA